MSDHQDLGHELTVQDLDLLEDMAPKLQLAKRSMSVKPSSGAYTSTYEEGLA